MSEVKHDNVYQAMAAAMAETGYVQKGGQMRSSAGTYTYAGEADMIEALRPVMVKHGLFIYPSTVVELRTEQYTTRNDAVMNLAMVIQEYRLAHESGTELVIQTSGAGADTGDKAIPKANTGSLKYALRQMFCIETGDDPDKDSSEHQERERRGNTPPSPQTRQQRPPGASQGTLPPVPTVSSVEISRLLAEIGMTDPAEKADAIGWAIDWNPVELTTQGAVVAAVTQWAIRDGITDDVAIRLVERIKSRPQEPGR